jgi:hypothetical protein
VSGDKVVMPQPPQLPPQDDRDRLAQAMATLGWSSRGLATRLQVAETTIRNWLTGRRGVPQNVLTWIEAKAAALSQVPDLPEGWHPGGDC